MLKLQILFVSLTRQILFALFTENTVQNPDLACYSGKNEKQMSKLKRLLYIKY